MRKNLISAMIVITVFFISVFLFPEVRELQNRKVYSIKSLLDVRASDSVSSKIIDYLPHNQWINVISQQGKWLKIRLLNGKMGFIAEEFTTDVWLKILKEERLLFVMKGDKELVKFKVALGFNPYGDKVKLKDGCTPEGRFYICEVLTNPKPSSSYGPFSLRVSYPNIEDARRGLKDKIINKAEYLGIVRAIHKGEMPPQKTGLGGSIKIHGGDYGVNSDWTLGCVALNNPELLKVLKFLPDEWKMILVDIYKNGHQEQNYNNSEWINRRILDEAERGIKRGCTYTGQAINIIPMSFPMGDIDSTMGVCTDVAVRALRGIPLDLQALVFEDINLFPKRYPGVSQPNSNIDHRRTRILKTFLDYNSMVLTINSPSMSPNAWKAGDIVLMDTGIDNGTIYDHIGIVSDKKNAKGIPLVNNLWTVGYLQSNMELLNGDYPKIVGHYRILNPIFYDLK